MNSLNNVLRHLLAQLFILFFIIVKMCIIAKTSQTQVHSLQKKRSRTQVPLKKIRKIQTQVFSEPRLNK